MSVNVRRTRVTGFVSVNVRRTRVTGFVSGASLFSNEHNMLWLTYHLRTCKFLTRETKTCVDIRIQLSSGASSSGASSSGASISDAGKDMDSFENKYILITTNIYLALKYIFLLLNDKKQRSARLTKQKQLTVYCRSPRSR